MDTGQLWRGWKRHQKIRPAVTPQEVANSQKAIDKQREIDYPAYVEYRDLLHLAVSLEYRWELDSMVSVNPTDHLNTGADFADKYRYSDCRVVPIATMEKLCIAYLAMEREQAVKSTYVTQVAQPA